MFGVVCKARCRASFAGDLTGVVNKLYPVSEKWRPRPVTSVRCRISPLPHWIANLPVEPHIRFRRIRVGSGNLRGRQELDGTVDARARPSVPEAGGIVVLVCYVLSGMSRVLRLWSPGSKRLRSRGLADGDSGETLGLCAAELDRGDGCGQHVGKGLRSARLIFELTLDDVSRQAGQVLLDDVGDQSLVDGHDDAD